jgi:RHS repeat-associated protein
MLTRVLSGQTTNLTYDAENHLTGASGAATATFDYDGDGQRMKATLGGVTTVYIGNHFEWTGSTSTMIKYFYAGTQRVAMKKGSTVYFLLGDHLGSTTLTTNSSGTKVGELRYKAWGENRFSSGTTYTARHFTGQLDETSSVGLYFFNARFYDPVLGRFSSADSIIPEPGNPQAWDRYAGMYNNPVNQT